MSGGKESPRQKMIGMMYLFYTALLALNISSDILNAFILVNDSMVQTNENFGSKNELILNAFEKQLGINEKKVKPFYDKAMQAEAFSVELVEYLEWLNDTLVIATEFNGEITENFEYTLEDVNGDDSVITYERAHEIPVIRLKKKDKYNVPQQILIGGIPGITEQAEVMKEKFAEYNENILGLLSEKDRKDIKLGLQTDRAWNAQEKRWEEWEHNTFHHGVLIADIVIINKYISEVLNTEAEVIAKLYSYIDAKSIKFDAVRAAVIPKSNVVIAGSDYEADIFVAAYSKTDIPKVSIKIKADTLTMDEINNEGIININEATGGITKFKLKTSATGEFSYAGFIQVKGPDGKYTPYFFNSSYQVIKPSATVSADAVNVVYRGIENPISVSAPGFTNDKLRLSGGAGGVLKSKGGGHYVYVPGKKQRKDIKFNVTGTKSDGSSQNMGSFPFRVLPVPSPTVRLAGVTEGEVSKGALKNQGFLTAALENFLFDLKYSVIEFRINVTGNRGMLVDKKIKGNKIPKSVIKKIMKAPKGAMVVISGIKSRGKDGVKSSSGVTLTLK